MTDCGNDGRTVAEDRERPCWNRGRLPPHAVRPGRLVVVLEPTRVLPGEEVAHELPMPLVLEMLAVAIRRGASIPHALIVVGRIVGGDFGEGLSSSEVR